MKITPQNLPAISSWESAYLRFETPEEEIKKFLRRLRSLGMDKWPRNAKIVELFCGRGNGLHALSRLGFQCLEGVDLSPRLLAQYEGPARCYVGDCRSLHFDDQSKDVVIVQGGLHHLPSLPDDLVRAFSEICRVLQNSGRVIIVEPWQTPFLRVTHVVSESPLMRRVSNKLDALATMIEHERDTYENWLRRPGEILAIARKYFVVIHESFRWGKWNFVGFPHPPSKS